VPKGSRREDRRRAVKTLPESVSTCNHFVIYLPYLPGISGPFI
jgi:hypothetical protein